MPGAATMLQPRAVKGERAKQSTKRSACVGFHLEQGATGRARGTRVEKGGNLLLQQVSLQGAEELFGLRQGQPELLDALVVFVEGDHLGDGLFLTLITAQDELKFDTHTGASPGSSDRWLIQPIVPGLIPSPQPLPAFIANGCGVRNFQGRQPSRAIPDALLAAERIIGI